MFASDFFPLLAQERKRRHHFLSPLQIHFHFGRSTFLFLRAGVQDFVEKNLCHSEMLDVNSNKGKQYKSLLVSISLNNALSTSLNPIVDCLPGMP